MSIHCPPESVSFSAASRRLAPRAVLALGALGCFWLCRDVFLASPDAPPVTFLWIAGSALLSAAVIVSVKWGRGGLSVDDLGRVAAALDGGGEAGFRSGQRLRAILPFCPAGGNVRHDPHAQNRLREQDALLELASDALLALDLEGRVTFLNPAALRLLGCTAHKVLGHPIETLCPHPPARQFARIRAAVLAVGAWQGELVYRDANGREHQLGLRATARRDAAGEPTGYLVACQDITEHKRLQEQFLRAQRLESIGLLAAGIAHDLNNLLGPIGIVSGILREHCRDQEDAQLLDTLDRSVGRGADLIRQVLGFTHGISGGSRLVQVKHLARDVVVIAKETFPKSITVADDIARDLLPVDCNPTQIHQVLMNLCVNARDAMPDGGVLTVRATNRSLDAAAAAKIEGARPGAWVVLEVTDTGTGIAADVLPRIWEPFFTTKAPDKGTGLGLPTVRGIVIAHHGVIELDTAVGRGTTFRVYLPAAPQTAPDDATETATTRAAGNGQRILVVDDEAPIRDTLGKILKSAGYRVVTASNGRDAVEHFDAGGNRFDAVIVDNRMPVMDGDRFAGIVRARFPGVRILGISGDTTDDAAGLRDADLDKPFTASALLSAVAQLLEATPAAA